jgi:putative membrane protein
MSSNYVRNASLFAAAAFLAAATTLAQQEPGGSSPNPGAQQQQQQPMPQGAPGQGVPTTDNGQTDFQKMADQSFVRKTMENDEAQIRFSQLAGQKSSSDDVKQFSQQMVKAHTALDSQLQPAAKQLDVDQPKEPSKKEKKELERLQGLSGQDFDTAYLQDMGHAQQESLKQFNDEAKDKSGGSLQQAATQDTPVLTQHYQMLEKLAQTHNVDLEAKEGK